MHVCKAWGLALCLACLVTSGVRAQEHGLAGRALACAAWMQALANSTALSPVQTARLERSVALLAELHLKESGRPMASDALSASMQEAWVRLHHSAAGAVPVVPEELVLCGAWSEGLLAQGEHLLFAPVYPKLVAPALRRQYEDLARSAVRPARP